MKCHYENLTKIKKESFSLLTLPLFLSLLLFPTVSFMIKQTKLLTFKFLISKCSLTSLFKMPTPFSYQTNHYYPRKMHSSTPILKFVVLPKICFSTIFPAPGLGYGKLLSLRAQLHCQYLPWGFFWTETISPPSGFSQHIVQIFIQHIRLPIIVLSFLCICHHPPFQIISSLMIGTVSYSFLCLSQNLPYSRHSLMN